MLQFFSVKFLCSELLVPTQTSGFPSLFFHWQVFYQYTNGTISLLLGSFGLPCKYKGVHLDATCPN